MAQVQPGRFSADCDGEVVVFLIGMRVNKLRKVRQWMSVATSMSPMLRELATHPDTGFLGYEIFPRGRLLLLVQYWRSFADLERFARDPDAPHLPAWREFNRRVGTSGDVGIFHETYVVPARSSESIYNNMPAFGLSKAFGSVPVGRRGQSAAYRAGVASSDDPAEPVPV